MKPKKTAIAILMLALMAFAAHADTHLNELMCAAWDGNTAEVRRLIEAGADVNAKNEEDETALMYAAEADAVDALRLLLASGADVNAKTHSGETALMYAAKWRRAEVVKLLIDAGADVNVKDKYGETALTIAVKWEAKDTAWLLLKAGAQGDADMIAQLRAEQTDELIYAAERHETAEIKRLIELGADVNARDDDGWTALIYASGAGLEDYCVEPVKLLLAAGADVNAKNKNGFTALMKAVTNNFTEAEKLLLDAGADVNAKTHSGKTALMYAAEGGYAAKGGYVASVKLLIEAGADVSAQDNDGKTALMIAERRQYPKVVELLRAAARPPFSKEDVAAYIARAGNDGIWREGRSSVLVERNKPATEYELDKIWDGDLATAWVEGVAGAGIGEYATISVQFPQLSFKKITSNVKVKGKLRMNNGFCRSEKLFRDNNRVKRALLTVYAVPLRAAKAGTTALDPGPLRLKEFEIAVADTSGLQVFDFDAEIPPRADVDGDGTVALFLRLTILDVYRGERYDDTCISELHATAEIAR